MSYAQSKYLSPRGLDGLNKVGDVVLPGDGNFPRYSDTGCSCHVDEVLEVTHPDDVAGLKLLLPVMSFMPAAFIRALLRLSELEQHAPGIIGTGLRLIGLALRGVPLSLYYSNLTAPYYRGKTVYEVIGYDVHVEPDYE